jgi:hypothetical protein
VVGALVEGCSIRTVERTTEIHRDTIMSLGVRVGEACGPLPEAKSPQFWVMSNLRQLSGAALHCRVVAQRSNLQSSGEEQDDQDKEDDSADSNSTTRTIGVVAAATAEQQKQDQND